MQTLEGSIAVAETVKNCVPDVVACYPITPSTHIAEALARHYADGKLKSYITVEAEFSAISALIGASATGARSFTTTSSQGLALMHEALFCAAGMRLPMVAVVANRALSAPLSIWNDHQDTISERDSGWIQLYCETNQEVVDTIPLAFKLSESTFLPVMVCMDGFYLTHAVEQLEVPSEEFIKQFLPPFKPAAVLDSEKPISIGTYAFPKDYNSFRRDINDDLFASKNTFKKLDAEWKKLTGRGYGLLEEYKTKDADSIFLAMGSITGNAKEAVDELRAKGEKVGVLKLKCYRPFPNEELAEALSHAKHVAVFEKDVSLGGAPPLFSEVEHALATLSEKEKPILSSFLGGIGGTDITSNDVKLIFKKISSGKRLMEWYG
ncbi:MAG: transketolase C-terminal domain-containing protein [Candidatus Micrarchaeota archaeon]